MAKKELKNYRKGPENFGGGATFFRDPPQQLLAPPPRKKLGGGIFKGFSKIFLMIFSFEKFFLIKKFFFLIKNFFSYTFSFKNFSDGPKKVVGGGQLFSETPLQLFWDPQNFRVTYGISTLQLRALGFRYLDIIIFLSCQI